MVWLKRVGVALGVVILAAAVAVGASYLAYRNDTRIDTRNGIDEAGYLKVGGIDQWVQIRGDDRNNPVLLWLNGGPGFSTVPSTFAFRTWEKRFTVAMWDQRGEGKTFARSGTSVKDTMTIDQMTKDGIEVTEHLRARLGKDKIILLGHSWGSILGVHMVHARPDLFSAYVGTGQVVNLEKDAEAAYPMLIEQARALRNATAEQQLVAVGPPPYPVDGFNKYVWVSWANALDPPAKGRLSLAAAWPVLANVVAGQSGFQPDAQFSGESLWGEMIDDDLPSLGLKFDLPVVFVQGAEDRLTATSLARGYFDSIEAPSKEFIVLDGAGHNAIFGDRDAFLDALDRRVRLLAQSN
jgi:pimeloyl-ACP methyl ester carboxylesterase